MGDIKTTERQKQRKTIVLEKYNIWNEKFTAWWFLTCEDGINTFHPVSPLNEALIPGENAWTASWGLWKVEGMQMGQWGQNLKCHQIGARLLTLLLPSLDSKTPQNLEGQYGCTQITPGVALSFWSEDQERRLLGFIKLAEPPDHFSVPSSPSPKHFYSISGGSGDNKDCGCWGGCQSSDKEGAFSMTVTVVPGVWDKLSLLFLPVWPPIDWAWMLSQPWEVHNWMGN